MPVDILTRTEKGLRLDISELDQNLTDLQDAVNNANNETINISVDTILGVYRTVFVDAAIATVTATLPPVATSTDKVFIIKKIDSSPNVVTIATDGADVIEGTTHLTLTSQWEVVRVVSDGTYWYVI